MQTPDNLFAGLLAMDVSPSAMRIVSSETSTKPVFQRMTDLLLMLPGEQLRTKSVKVPQRLRHSSWQVVQVFFPLSSFSQCHFHTR
jgi:hypothetical protein